jgi:Cdc6-like AAA superfamily ATPase
LDAYSDQQLVDILERRVASGLVENIVDDDALWAMARRSEGNAREAIWHLRFGIKHVRAGNADRVTTGVVDETSTLARADLVRKVFSRLDREHRVICEVLFEHGELGASELHDELVSTLGESMSPRKRQRLVSKILDGSGYDLVAKSGKGPSTSYRLTDRTRELFESGELP